jgi:hypothetical protein
MDQRLTKLASDDLIHEQAILIARGVRALALIGTCEAEQVVMLRVATKIERLAYGHIIPFVLDRRDGTAEYGYAAAQWVLDLLRWLFWDSPETIPPKQKDRILGLLCGYGVEAIRSFEERGSGRLFEVLILSDGSASSLSLDDNCDREGKSRLC